MTTGGDGSGGTAINNDSDQNHIIQRRRPPPCTCTLRVITATCGHARFISAMASRSATSISYKLPWHPDANNRNNAFN